MTMEWGKFAMTPSEVADSIGIQDEKTVLGWLREGRLKGVNFRGRIGWRVRPDDVAAFLREEVDKQSAATQNKIEQQSGNIDINEETQP